MLLNNKFGELKSDNFGEVQLHCFQSEKYFDFTVYYYKFLLEQTIYNANNEREFEQTQFAYHEYCHCSVS